MTITVSVSQFREDLSTYLARAQAGDRIVVRDEKKGAEVAELIGKKPFDPEVFRQILREVAGSISTKDHPEWATPAKISRWLRRERKSAERHFHVPVRQ